MMTIKATTMEPYIPLENVDLDSVLNDTKQFREDFLRYIMGELLTKNLLSTGRMVNWLDEKIHEMESKLLRRESFIVMIPDRKYGNLVFEIKVSENNVVWYGVYGFLGEGIKRVNSKFYIHAFKTLQYYAKMFKRGNHVMKMKECDRIAHDFESEVIRRDHDRSFHIQRRIQKRNEKKQEMM